MSPLILLLRPHQWLKNLVLLFPPFLAGKIHQIPSVVELLAPLLAFSLVSSVVYIINDIADCRSDALHPVKRLRPLPSGAVTPYAAKVVALCCIMLAFALALGLVPVLVPWMLVYLLCSVFYTLIAKHVFLLDLGMIALLFVVRLQAGGAAYAIRITLWLYMAVFLLALFLSAGKRLSEFYVLGTTAAQHRISLARYRPESLRLILYASGACVLIAYASYCFTHLRLLVTLPLCAYGLWRYIRRVRNGGDGDPTISLLHDKHLLAVGCCWVLIIALVQYPVLG